MPELPEVETIAQGLRPHICGQIIADIRLNRKDLRFPIPPHLPYKATGQGITGITRRGKYLFIHLQKHHSILIHLGMSGRLLYHVQAAEPKKHDHVVIRFALGGELIFNDPRRFGIIDFLPTSDIDVHPLISVLGIEPLTPKCSGDYLYNLTQKNRSPIKSLIMDSHKIVGVGNIYACEALFMARIHPSRISNTLSPSECNSLVEAIKVTLLKAIAAGGSTLKDYTKASGEAGYFQHQFTVYDRKDEPCIQCHTPVEQYRQNGRSTYACLQCQA